MTGDGDGVIISKCGITVTSQCLAAVLQLLPAPGHPPAHVPVWDTLVRTGEMGTVAKMFTVSVGVVAVGVEEVMDTCLTYVLMARLQDGSGITIRSSRESMIGDNNKLVMLCDMVD